MFTSRQVRSPPRAHDQLPARSNTFTFGYPAYTPNAVPAAVHVAYVESANLALMGFCLALYTTTLSSPSPGGTSARMWLDVATIAITIATVLSFTAVFAPQFQRFKWNFLGVNTFMTSTSIALALTTTVLVTTVRLQDRTS